jgi:hypothetical protein
MVNPSLTTTSHVSTEVTTHDLTTDFVQTPFYSLVRVEDS